MRTVTTLVILAGLWRGIISTAGTLEEAGKASGLGQGVCANAKSADSRANEAQAQASQQKWNPLAQVNAGLARGRANLLQSNCEIAKQVQIGRAHV